MIFSIYLYKKLYLHISSVYNSLIFTKTYLFSKILKKLLTKLSFSDEAGLKPITILKSIYTESLSAVVLEMHLLRNSFKQIHIKVQPVIC